MSEREDSKTGSNQMWGGRFEKGPASIMEDINVSIDFDKRLAEQDLAGSEAHAAMLAKQKIIPAKDGKAIAAGLGKILKRIEAGDFSMGAGAAAPKSREEWVERDYDEAPAHKVTISKPFYLGIHEVKMEIKGPK